MKFLHHESVKSKKPRKPDPALDFSTPYPGVMDRTPSHLGQAQ